MTEDISPERLDAMMRKIKSLIARADHPNTPEHEADSARAMAEKMMVKYRIDESELIESGMAGDMYKPSLRIVPIIPVDNEYKDTYRAMMGYIVSHVGAKMAYGHDWVDGVFYQVAHIVGYEADVRFAELLYMQARVYFADRMEPKPDPSLSDAENVYRMRSAGMERIRIASLMGWVKGGAKVTRLYKQACIEKGEDPDALTGKGNNVKVFREAYAEAFKTQLWNNLWRARDASDGATGALVLVGRAEKVEEAFYEHFPHLRPVPASRGIGEETNRRAARLYKESAAERRKRERLYSKTGQAGMAAGRKAADGVNVQGVAPKKRIGE